MGFNQRELLLLYNSIDLPTLTYCCSVWGGAAKGTFGRVDAVQRNGIISSYIPIAQIIKNADERLYDCIAKLGSHTTHASPRDPYEVQLRQLSPAI